MSAGTGHSLALTADAAVWSWGRGGFGRLGHGDQQHQLLPKKIEAFAGRRVVAVSAGGEHSLAITADGVIWSWGGGIFGKLGHGDEQRQLLPKKVEAFAGRRVVAVSAGEGHSIALAADGALFTSGRGESGCLGHGEDLPNQLLPTKTRRGSRSCSIHFLGRWGSAADGREGGSCTSRSRTHWGRHCVVWALWGCAVGR